MIKVFLLFDETQKTDEYIGNLVFFNQRDPIKEFHTYQFIHYSKNNRIEPRPITQIKSEYPNGTIDK